MTPRGNYPPGSFHSDERVYEASPKIYTSEMFPYLEPYTAEHELFFRNLMDANKSGAKAEDNMPLAKDGLFILLRDFVYVWQHDDGTWYRLTVPAGYVTDGASYPWGIQWLFRVYKTGYVTPAALAHDLTYQLKGLMADVPVVQAFYWRGPSDVNLTLGWHQDTRVWPKQACDKFFLKIMNAYGTRLSKPTYWGVKYGGHLAYLGNDKSRFYTAALYNLPAEERNSWPR